MSRPTDQDLDRSVAAILRLGTSVATLIVLIGGFFLLTKPSGLPADYRTFQPGNPALRSITGIFQGTIDLAPKSIIQLGVVVLIITPVVRVILCMVGFARQRSALYVGISAFVLTILLYGLIRR